MKMEALVFVDSCQLRSALYFGVWRTFQFTERIFDGCALRLGLPGVQLR